MFPRRVDEGKLYEDWPDDTYRFGLPGPPYKDEPCMWVDGEDYEKTSIVSSAWFGN
jgi:hypothetical protein